MNKRKQAPNLAVTNICNFMKARIILLVAFFSVSISSVFSQTENQDNDYKKHFIGSTLFMLANLAPDPPHYYQLNFGYRITPKDVISVEAITWEYKGPPGRPWGSDFENVESKNLIIPVL